MHSPEQGTPVPGMELGMINRTLRVPLASRPLAGVGAAVGAILLAMLVVTVNPRELVRRRSGVLETDNLALTPVILGLKEPTWVIGAPDGRLIALERAGMVRVMRDGVLLQAPALDLTDRISVDSEEGLLCLVFDPHFTDDGYVYVDYTDRSLAIQVVRYQFTADDPDRLDPASAHTILTVPKKNPAHNGGTLAFGPDGYLYVSVGDDEHDVDAQDLSSLHGKILRLDTAGGDPYAIPPGNPFATRTGAAPEIWSYGLRNPWRFSFDPPTGDVWIGDVGDVTRDEIDLQPAASGGGENYGWPEQEGSVWHCDTTTIAPCPFPGVTEPILDYPSHESMMCALIGGYVYRGSAAPGLVGAYIFGDLCTGRVMAAVKDDAQNGSWKRVILSAQPIKISSLGEDANHELYVVDMQGGVVYRVSGGSLPAA
jgi:glucose/arabinose dehydrogenase